MPSASPLAIKGKGDNDLWLRVGIVGMSDFDAPMTVFSLTVSQRCGEHGRRQQHSKHERRYEAG